MKHTVTALLLALTVLTIAQAEKNAQAQRAEMTMQTLATLQEKCVGALAKSDTATLNSILSDTFVDTNERGQRTDKQSVLSVLDSGDLKFEYIKLSNLRVHLYGNAAVVTGIAVQGGAFKSQPLTAKTVFINHFLKQNGRWRVVACRRSAM